MTTSVVIAACSGADKTKAGAPATAATPAPTVSTGPSAILVSPDSAALAVRAPDTFSMVLNTSKGEIEIEVKRALAPRGADRLYFLASNGYFNGSRFFRVVYDFVAQFGLSGIPMIDREWDERTLLDDPPKTSNTKGTVVFAKNKPNGRSTQLFINLKDNSAVLDKQKFAPVGRVVRGMDVAAQLLSTYGDLPNQKGLIMSQGNKYLRQRYAELDTIATVTIKK
ncbi:MAG: peptidylprolyl isomerase [Gemmatimonas sp.]